MKKPYTIEKGPFLAVPFSGGMTATFGGPKISLKGEVLNTESKPVPGLYAAGNAIGGLFYDDYLSGSQMRRQPARKPRKKVLSSPPGGSHGRLPGEGHF